MKNKILIIIPILLVILVIITGIIFINNLNKESQETKEKMNQIITNYTLLEEYTKNYNQIRDLLIDNNTYYQETFNNDYSNIIKNFQQYDNIINQIKEVITNINKNCENKNYNDTKVNKICTNYKQTYEKMYNIYINDINNFNKIVDNYNNETNSNLEKFTTSNGINYIDYDKDGEYLGKK